MVNLIAGRRIVPELLNQRFTAANLAAALRPLLDDTPARQQMIADLAEARASSCPTQPPTPSTASATPPKPSCNPLRPHSPNTPTHI